MTHLDVKNHLEALTKLIEHLNPESAPCKIFHVNYGLTRNLDRLTSAVREIDKSVNKELKDLEQEAYKLGENNFRAGMDLLPTEKKERHDVLVAEYLKEMEAENDLELYYLDAEKCEALEIEFEWMLILSKFIRK